ncbi:uncharacterized protein [Anabrus simplex]|uniref:uncharacterized protein isoform X1 n=1 Tax=Anabrus simplex TaxID=316456 RepID=UPI0035A33C81
MAVNVPVLSEELSRLLSSLGSGDEFTLNHIMNQSEDVRGPFMNYIHSIVSPDKFSSEPTITTTTTSEAASNSMPRLGCCRIQGLKFRILPLSTVMAFLAKLGFCDLSTGLEVLKKSEVDYDLLTFWIGLLNNLKSVQLSMRLSPSEATGDADGIDHLKMLLNDRIDFQCLLSNRVPKEVDLDGKQKKENYDSSESLAVKKSSAHNLEKLKNISEELSAILTKLSNKVCVEDGFQEPFQGCEQLCEYCSALQFPTNLKKVVECPTEEPLSISHNVRCDTIDKTASEIAAFPQDLKNMSSLRSF